MCQRTGWRPAERQRRKGVYGWGLRAQGIVTVLGEQLAESAGWEGPLFIVGMPRSGTRLLRDLLNRHPRIRANDIETEFLPFLVRWVNEHGEPDSERAFSDLHASLSRSPYFTYRNARRAAFSPAEWAERCNGQFGAAGLFEGFVRYELSISAGSGIVWGDKSPAYIAHLDLLSQHFPRSRVIHLVRDVRDYCVSIRDAWHKDVGRAAHRWGQDVLAAHRHCAAQNARCIEVRYEDLVRAPAEQLTRLCAFLRLEFAPRMARLARPATRDGVAKDSTEIVNAGVGKYADALSRRELETVESLAMTAMRELGYEPQLACSQSRLGPVSLACRRIKDGLQLLRNDAARFGALGALRFHAQHRRISRV